MVELAFFPLEYGMTGARFAFSLLAIHSLSTNLLRSVSSPDLHVALMILRDGERVSSWWDRGSAEISRQHLCEAVKN